MRIIVTMTALALMATTAGAAVPIFDSNGFEACTAGAVAGQNAWFNTDLDPAQPSMPVMVVDDAPRGHGHALSFENLSNTESGAAVAFPDLVGTQRYVQVAFSFYRDGSGLTNNLLWYGTGPAATPWYGLAWDNGGSAPAQVLPAGFAAPGTLQTPGQWMDIALLYDLLNGTASEYVNGQVLAENVAVGTAKPFSGWAFDDQYDSATGSPGERAYVDDFRVVADDVPIPLVPEPGSLALMSAAIPVLLAWRRRKTVKAGTLHLQHD